MAIKIGINGFGRIGRSVLRAAKLIRKSDFDFVAINDLTDAEKLSTVLKYDSVHGTYPGEISISNGNLSVDGDIIKMVSERNPADLPWGELDVDFVIEATGLFRERKQLEGHLDAGAKKVILTVPPKDDIDATIVLGVNDDTLTGEEKIISNASCTTNCAATVTKVIHEAFDIKRGYLSTIHAYTMDQKLLDYPHKDMRRARAASLSIIPTSTGAAKTLGVVLPSLAGKIDGMSFRVPIPDGSIVDLIFEVNKSTTVEEINKVMKEATEKEMKGYIEYTEDPIVSVDIKGNIHSAIFDSELTRAMDPNFIKVSAWYDNEMGYACRVVDLISKMDELSGAAS
ncbi:type I glyceraldehyde-3-phosphate dehydrogenase [Candidatus Marinimicrobia bacterium MT.SAG.3]|nr:type I glyceraldehyde-3-phosphate dehydrogenase [Candidatus Marinimicrobia bacterium MT.SAG.3]TFB12567.1 type I glyceraldehyde-3-phosphate dehydrogenase [Candidatus Marinimicrobia bacterium MT.SAG.4]